MVLIIRTSIINWPLLILDSICYDLSGKFTAMRSYPVLGTKIRPAVYSLFLIINVPPSRDTINSATNHKDAKIVSGPIRYGAGAT